MVYVFVGVFSVLLLAYTVLLLICALVLRSNPKVRRLRDVAVQIETEVHTENVLEEKGVRSKEVQTEVKTRHWNVQIQIGRFNESQ